LAHDGTDLQGAALVPALLQRERMVRSVLVGVGASLAFGFAFIACSSGRGSAVGGGTDAASEPTVEGGGDGNLDGGDGGTAGDGEGGDQACTGVCGSGPSWVCASQYKTSACFGGNCCILAADSGPPYFDDAGTCPGQCASPDDIGCPHWYRSSGCAAGDLCCVVGIDRDP
jgi:hypothetical protein